jgi:HEAT repeat protein
MRLKALATLLFVLGSVFVAGVPGDVARAQRKRPPAAANNNASQASKSADQKKHIFVGRGADTARGSRVTIKSDNPLNDYSAYRSGDRFYVVLPRADANGVARGGGGKGYSDMQVQQRGSDVVLSYRVQPGAKPRVEQKFNRLDVVFDAPEGAQGNSGAAANNANNNTANRGAANPAENRNPNASQQPAGQNPNAQQNPNAAANDRRTAAQAGNKGQTQAVDAGQTQAANAGQAQAANNGQTEAAAPPPTTTGEQAPGVEQSASNPPAATEQTQAGTPAATAPEGQQVAEAQPPATVGPITNPDATTGTPSGASLGTFLLRNWALALIVALALAGFGLIFAARRTSAASPAALEEADEATTDALEESRASRLKTAPASAELRAADTNGLASKIIKTAAPPLVAVSALAAGAAVEKKKESKAAVEEAKKSREEEAKKSKEEEKSAAEPTAAEPSVVEPPVVVPVAGQPSAEGAAVEAGQRGLVEAAAGVALEEVSKGVVPAAETGAKSEPEVVTEPVAVDAEVKGIAPAAPPEQEKVEAETRRLLEGGNYDRSVVGTSDALARQLIAAELLSALAGRNAERRERARAAFVEHGYFDEKARDLREANAPAERAAAARSLAIVGDRAATPHLIVALKDESVDVRRAAVEALGALRDPAAVTPLESLFERERDQRNRVPSRVIRHALETCRVAAEDEAHAAVSAPAEAAGEAAQVEPAAVAPVESAPVETAQAEEAAHAVRVEPTHEASSVVEETSVEALAPVAGEVAAPEEVIAPEDVAHEDSGEVAAVEAAPAAAEEIHAARAVWPFFKQSAEPTVAVEALEPAEASHAGAESAVVEPPAEDVAAVVGSPADAQQPAKGIEPVADAQEFEAGEHSAVVEQSGKRVVAIEPIWLFDEGDAAHETTESVAAHTDVAEDLTEESSESSVEISPLVAGEWVDFDLLDAEAAPQTTSVEPSASLFESSSGEALPTDTVSPESAPPSEGARGVERFTGASVEKEIVPGGAGESSAPPVLESVPSVPLAATSEKGVAPFDEFSTVPASIQQRLASQDAAERAAAITELSHVDSDEAFQQICAAFDDDDREVRSAAARALYELRSDRAESFTRALREAQPERRRHIGSAISSSGLAGEAVSQLTGESREKTYEAFSLLFLMAKAGEVQPLIRAIEGHPNSEVRLAVVKLLALSGQKEILPAFRRLAVRGSLPTEVRSAVMEAIYQISSSQSSAA